jgi:hypothetical protein
MLMAMARRDKPTEKQLQGFKHFRKLLPLFERLHPVGTQRDRAGNRTLHMDQYCALVLLYMFNPVVSSLRAIQQASELKKVQRLLGCQRASLGSLSEAVDVFEPDRLQEIVQELAEQLQPIARDQRLEAIDKTITLADGTILQALPRIARAMWIAKHSGNVKHSWRLHAQFVLDKHVPLRMDLTNGSGAGDNDERVMLKGALEAGRCYVMDRGYAQFTLFNAIIAAESSYVCRVRDNSAYDVIEQRALSNEAVQANVISDQIIHMGTSSRKSAQPNHTMRLIEVKATPHHKRCGAKGRAGPPSDGVLRIATDMLDVPAEIIAILYSHRFTIELFFRFFKQVLGCRHLLSDDPKGITIQTYCAIIACMLIALYTGRKPTKRTCEMVCYFMIGLADEEELLAHLAKLPPQER